MAAVAGACQPVPDSTTGQCRACQGRSVQQKKCARSCWAHKGAYHRWHRPQHICDHNPLIPAQTASYSQAGKSPQHKMAQQQLSNMAYDCKA